MLCGLHISNMSMNILYDAASQHEIEMRLIAHMGKITFNKKPILYDTA